MTTCGQYSSQFSREKSLAAIKIDYWQWIVSLEFNYFDWIAGYKTVA
jgi:hypothetical protein